jgi:hypothetical protein
MDMWKSLDKFRNEISDSYSDDESDKTTHVIASAASILREHNANQMPVYRGSMKGRSR